MLASRARPCSHAFDFDTCAHCPFACTLQGNSFEAETTVTPTGSTGLDSSVMGDLFSAASATSATGVTVADVQPPAVVPECNNQLCETGEVCGASDDSCCIADCPVRYIECPTTEGEPQPCSARGSCDYAAGTCTCMYGYTGEACDICADGFKMTDGACVAYRFLDPNYQAPVTPPENVTTVRCYRCLLSGGAWALVAFLIFCAVVAVIVLVKWMCTDFYPSAAASMDVKSQIPLQTPAQAMAANVGGVALPQGAGLVPTMGVQTMSFGALKKANRAASNSYRVPATASDAQSPDNAQVAP